MGLGTPRGARPFVALLQVPCILDIDRGQASVFATWIEGLATISAAAAAPGKITWKDLGAGAAAMLDAE
ncbi:hypothetical protein [Novosphingobium sp. BL-52-GroH]|uniref:hypothetical protein n=1 Tax=Novosphingobium sp. BL-52-GroH TaxID=3349877 RepID=UPI0038516B9E